MLAAHLRTGFLTFATACALALGSIGCSAEAQSDLDDDADQEGSETVSEEALRLGNANRQGFKEPVYSTSEKEAVLARYSHIDRSNVVSGVLLDNALQYYHFNLQRIRNPRYLTIIDFSLHSSKRRLFIIDMQSGRVEPHVVAHGSGSDPANAGIPSGFSNREGSNASSLGYYVTAETYSGKWGYSLRLDGLSATNSNVRARAVVMHGASYVDDGRSLQGRSWGCPALPMDEKDAVINKVKGGSLLYADLPRR
ncbi:MAG: murein L,D-transpeptidase catalytic domain family protein [Myxococcales bacterium]|mgnify:CR=1 FL=1|nr:murein L,D-transpeptidase catalytic domain family protein [Myxococcales bacterium]MBL0194783.1 murein L,D-transpeptidase catalytic domain family protein [Myxococcales bacterium]HQY64661.1 murein L,D-transpeptidase catalytic domain family protein [Polyangiaceae bacterium]